MGIEAFNLFFSLTHLLTVFSLPSSVVCHLLFPPFYPSSLQPFHLYTLAAGGQTADDEKWSFDLILQKMYN
jgi:hypothetical protein